MAGAERKYALDSNLFIGGFRDAQKGAALEAFHAAFAPFEYLAAVVAMELRAGASGKAAALLERHVIGPFERRGRIVTPGFAAWKEAGRVLAELRERDGLEFARVSRSFVNDVLLALSCRDAGVVVVTSNERDFSRIARVVDVEYAEPWPVPLP